MRDFQFISTIKKDKISDNDLLEQKLLLYELELFNETGKKSKLDNCEKIKIQKKLRRLYKI
ncbi:MAG: hypothetical protein KAQ98_09405 [Bacteriovoracaceae bacterium]|nr:hypothetical protein [Bacteriovoracaceae bacterium]